MKNLIQSIIATSVLLILSAVFGTLWANIEPNLFITCFACTCMTLTLVAIGFCIYFAKNIDGFAIEKQRYSRFEQANAYAKNVKANSSDYKWNLSFDEAADGYTFNKIYCAKVKPSSFYLAISKCNGSLQLIITQGRVSISERIEKGSYNLDMSKFATGKIDIKIISNGASDFSATFTMNR